MKFTLDIPEIPDSVSQKVSADTLRIIQSLRDARFSDPDLVFPPKSKFAAVLVLIYECSSPQEHLRVLLTTRSKALRTHAGQTALPGGRVDEPPDTNFLDTALRESHEEVALPLSHPSIHPLGLLEPFLSAHGLVVVPVMAFLSDPALLDILKAHEAEVSHIFSHPLQAVLDPTILLELEEKLVENGSEDWRYPEDLHNTTDHVIPTLANVSYRMHRFRGNASPVKGLTADVMIKVAELAYHERPKYDRYAPEQRHGAPAILDVIQTIERAKEEQENQAEELKSQ